MTKQRILKKWYKEGHLKHIIFRENSYAWWCRNMYTEWLSQHKIESHKRLLYKLERLFKKYKPQYWERYYNKHYKDNA